MHLLFLHPGAPELVREGVVQRQDAASDQGVEPLLPRHCRDEAYVTRAGRSRDPRRAIFRRSRGRPSPRKLGRRGDWGNVANKAWAGRVAMTPPKITTGGAG